MPQNVINASEDFEVSLSDYCFKNTWTFIPCTPQANELGAENQLLIIKINVDSQNMQPDMSYFCIFQNCFGPTTSYLLSHSKPKIMLSFTVLCKCISVTQQPRF